MEAHSVLSGRQRLDAGLAAALLAASLLAFSLPAPYAAIPIALLGAAGLVLVRRMASVEARAADVVLDALILGLFAAAQDPSFAVWQLPYKWMHLLRLTSTGSLTMVLLHLAASLAITLGGGRMPALRERLSLFILPLLFNLALSLGNGGMMHDLGAMVTQGIALPEPVNLVVGRAAILFAFCEILTGILRILVAGRLSYDPRFHALLLGAAVHAAMAPHIADLPPVVAGYGPLAAVVAILAAAGAQSGIWAIVYVVTGLTIDALNGTPPTFAAALGQWRGGATKGAIYGGVFMAIVVIAAAIMSIPGLAGFSAALPYLPGLLAGALLFPLAQTIVASADGTPPFFGRLRRNYRNRRSYARGAVIGLGAAFFLVGEVRDAMGPARFVASFALGALAYAGVDLAFDLLMWKQGRRQVMDRWQTYALGILLGGCVGGAIGWYFDADQVNVVTSKFWSYADLAYGASGRAVSDFTTYPLFNKYGAVNLGPVGGGTRLFFNESLSGVINWAIAAPLFSINFFVLSAIFQRSLAPLKQLFSPKGFQGLVEQAVRVLRWGLWMAPIINSFLRQSPDPAWYNQDGAVRSVAATIANTFLPAGAFRDWSLSIFTGLLAYDWLRVLIWFDHMGLRVATLVNLTFIGGDRADEAAARFVGHAGRTRVIPEGIRRFATWAPLLIPFYIPHGPDWDRAWTGAERIRATTPAWTAPVLSIALFYALAAGLAGLAGWILSKFWNGPGVSIAPVALGTPRALLLGPKAFGLSNGAMTVSFQVDGCGYTSVAGPARGSFPIDITRRPDNPLQLRGPFVFLRDTEAAQDWSLGFQPMHVVGEDYVVKQSAPNRIKIRNTIGGVRTEAWIRLAPNKPVEFFKIRLQNLEDRARRLEITSFRELAIHEIGAYFRDPDFNSMHIESWFVRPLYAILARNRLLRNPVTHRMSHETCFHAAKLGQGMTLLGYEDSRTRFIGPGGLRHPRGLDASSRRSLHDEGSLYTFDPAASLTVAVDLPPKGEAEITFVTGRAVNEADAARIVAKLVGVPAPDKDVLGATLRRKRLIEPGPVPPASTWPFEFRDETRLLLTPSTPRPWAHVLANPIGYGTVLSNEGEIHSFNGNERQNALTPFRLETGATLLPSQSIYVVDLETGEADTAGFVPFRRADAHHEVEYRLGAATFRNTRADIEIELTVFVFTDAPADVRLLKVTNRSDRAKTFRIVPYFEMALSESAGDSLGMLEVVRDEATESLLFSNPQNDFQRGWVFAVTSLMAAVTETVRTRFLGSPGRDQTNPVMVETGLADASREDDGRRVAAFAGTIEVPAGGTAEVAVVLGQTATKREALMTASHLRDPAAARAALKATEAWWAERLGGVRVETNNPAFDRLVNHWLPYQALASRLWGRTGPNQRGGAFGFRDQLQDVLPFMVFDASLTRRQIVIHAGVQFPEGDVFKWWHVAPDGRIALGQRTRASDPHLWLPYVVTRYVEATGDWSVLGEEQPYLEGPQIPPGVVDLVYSPKLSLEVGDVYDHCVRALDYTMARMGQHGLPLIGTGDWNDGIDAAGPAGRGEGTWLACFLYDILVRFVPIARRRGGSAAAERYAQEAERIAKAIEGVWTGDHYIFDFADDGRPLDPPSIMAAAWPVLSGAVGIERGRMALDHGLAALEKEDRILLVTPPFDEHSEPHPGRIADYPPGVRENGGQYTHGASWSVDAFVKIADLARAEGKLALAAEAKARAFTCWTKLSPLGKTEGDKLAVYGLAPHQQPADIYDGESYGGRGGWSWYTGSASRMLSAAYAIIGITMENGQILLPPDLLEPKGDLRVKSLTVKGQTFQAPKVEADLGARPLPEEVHSAAQ